MTISAVGICILCQLCLVTGHLLLKHAMNGTDNVAKSSAIVAWYIAGGTGLLAVWFFLWLGLLRTWDLSQIFPFEGLARPY